MKLIIAKPSPYARKARVALQEKGIAYEEIVNNPWLPEAIAGTHNPLGKVPILILDDGTTVFESSVIVEYLETLNREPQLLPKDGMSRVAVKQIEALADGICDAVVLLVLETRRAQQSQDWLARQRAKVVAGLDECERLLGKREHFVGDALTVADIAVGCALGYLDIRLPEHDWRSGHPRLIAFAERINTRASFQHTVPEPQEVVTLS